jgi:hypothetical protein
VRREHILFQLRTLGPALPHPTRWIGVSRQVRSAPSACVGVAKNSS